MNLSPLPPKASYGILQQTVCNTSEEQVIEQLKTVGYAVLDSGFTEEELTHFSKAFHETRSHYVEVHGAANLREINEYNTIRGPIAYNRDLFLTLASSPSLLRVIGSLIHGKFILNQQSGIINPPLQEYNQGAWHRDLPYQHFTSSYPIALNALFCIDPFTRENGATFVLPASHKSEPFPSQSYIERNAIQIEAKAGSYIILDCMLFHAGGFNQTKAERRAVNHVYTIPFIKQQIDLSAITKDYNLPDEAKALLGYPFTEPRSIDEYLATRRKKEHK
jgi:ectoine hydroxylase-related dioxygenase (phytanoyl-CoA dioxygenase family)